MWLAFNLLPGVLARSLRLSILLQPPPPFPYGGHLAWFAYLLPYSEWAVEWLLAHSALPCSKGGTTVSVLGESLRDYGMSREKPSPPAPPCHQTVVF